MGVGHFYFLKKIREKYAFPGRPPVSMHALPEFLYRQIRQSIRMHFLPTSSHEKEIPLNSIMIYGKMQDVHRMNSSSLLNAGYSTLALAFYGVDDLPKKYGDLEVRTL